MQRRNIKRTVLIVLGLAFLLLSLQLINVYFSRKAGKRQDLAYLALMPEKTFKLYETQMTSINQTAVREDVDSYCQQTDAQRHDSFFNFRLNDLFTDDFVDNCYSVVSRLVNVPADSLGLTKVLDSLGAAIGAQGFSNPTVLSKTEQGYYSYDAIRYEPPDTHTYGGICSTLLQYDVQAKTGGPGRLSYRLRCQHHTVGTPSGYTRTPYGSILK